ncbi:MexH family multidrug efflux RND transporter periplasmic adaptor subunit [Pseudohongiella nitratireducens]|uniref:MexH family multidrug efflux RND transporter periplasmic adaptor subunit n=1 Tax=Pseudohongiella nitratireducens TaxID=1768907 RepID=A0A917GJU6_9GAMM|nr:efflux RND transporter periplasmic adaptor subunit [Pseudohongiella nitratireducens]GGG49018.1 MexH family multidrug efflux RND transporter periplasmic adaptor subunit [Pseudohongiella nitratireducens]
MRAILRHPLLILFLIAVVVLTVSVFYKLNEQSSGAGGFAGGPGRPGGMAATPVTVATVGYEEMINRVQSVGTAMANESVNVTAKVSDTVSRVRFSDGDQVQRGDVLVELTNSAEMARLEEAQLAVDDARLQFDRFQPLADLNLVSQSDLDTAGNRVNTAEARLQGVVADMSDRLIMAPFDGVLGFRQVSEGSLVSPNTVITTLDDISTIKLDFTVAEVFLADINVGASIEAKSIVYQDRTFSGVVTVVGSRIDPATRSVQVRAEIPNPDGQLRPGMLMTVDMLLDQRETIVVPEEAVVPMQGRQYVYLVDDENIARQTVIKVGARQPGRVEILEGLVPGQQVITEGVGQVRPDTPVRIVNNAG